jgi:hypothetical protein
MVTLLFSLLIAGAFIGIFSGLRRALARTSWTPKRQRAVFIRALLVVVGWAALCAGFALAGFFANFSALPPRMPLAILLPLPVVLIIVFSRGGKELLQAMPPHWVVYAQSMRIGVELVIWYAVIDGLMPVQLSFEGRNFDIVTGLLAVPVGYYALVVRRWPVWVVVAYNLMGLGLLVNVLALAFLSMPTPLRVFLNEPANTLVAYFPFVYLPGLLVPLAYTLHIVSLRQTVLLWKINSLGSYPKRAT